MKEVLETGTLRYIDNEVVISLEKGDHCDHYDIILVSAQGMIFGLHLKTIEEVASLPFRWDMFTFERHKEGEVIGLVPLEPSEI